jgi:hypothetical protein
MNGTPAYPQPEQGYLAQDADLMLAFSVCEEYRQEQVRIEKQHEQVAALMKGW